MNKEPYYEEQRRRQEKFPKDRICYSPFPSSAKEDQRAMRMFVKGEISFRMLCRQLALNNYLDYVTDEQAWKALRDSGYIYDEED